MQDTKPVSAKHIAAKECAATGALHGQAGTDLLFLRLRQPHESTVCPLPAALNSPAMSQADQPGVLLSDAIAGSLPGTLPAVSSAGRLAPWAYVPNSCASQV
ncbi:hypothetical protein ACWCPF_27375 [Streptomyces sp. NPDC001858]